MINDLIKKKNTIQEAVNNDLNALKEVIKEIGLLDEDYNNNVGKCYKYDMAFGKEFYKLIGFDGTYYIYATVEIIENNKDRLPEVWFTTTYNNFMIDEKYEVDKTEYNNYLEKAISLAREAYTSVL